MKDIKFHIKVDEHDNVTEYVARHDLTTSANFIILQLNTCGVDVDSILSWKGLNIFLSLGDDYRDTNQPEQSAFLLLFSNHA